jgi:hypothetical protein
MSVTGNSHLSQHGLGHDGVVVVWVVVYQRRGDAEGGLGQAQRARHHHSLRATAVSWRVGSVVTDVQTRQGAWHET